jgi:hypothetical protein
MSAQEILTAITLAVSGWTLVKVIGLGEKVATLTERTHKLPCVNCKPQD